MLSRQHKILPANVLDVIVGANGKRFAATQAAAL
jgi:hypothetical protein